MGQWYDEGNWQNEEGDGKKAEAHIEREGKEEVEREKF